MTVVSSQISLPGVRDDGPIVFIRITEEDRANVPAPTCKMTRLQGSRLSQILKFTFRMGFVAQINAAGR
jgi:hypothetical protein